MKTRIDRFWIPAYRLFKCAMVLVVAVFLIASASAQNYGIIRSFSPQVLDNVTGYYTNSDGMYPSADVVLSGQTIYGTASEGGPGGGGTVFKVNFDGSGFAVLHHFAPPIADPSLGGFGTNSDGSSPQGRLLLLGSTLYGTTAESGPNAGGTIFKVDTNGNNFAVLTNFLENGANGCFPYAGLVSPDSNTLYGTTADGGAYNSGAVFKIGTNGNNYTIVHNFDLGFTTNGFGPYGQMIFSGTNLYGTTYAGASNNGCVYKMGTNGAGFTLLKSFSPMLNNTNSDGAEPYGRLLLSGNVLYGTAYAGGVYSNGVIFRVNTDGTAFTNLHSFTALTGGYYNSDGAQPKSAPSIAGPTLYGTTPYGGGMGEGTIYYLDTTTSTFYTLRTFGVNTPQTPDDGTVPNAGFALSGATFWGVTQYGGTNQTGTIFRFQWDNTPPVSIAQAGHKAVLSWPTDDYADSVNDFNFTLQSTPSLVNAVWTNVTVTPVIINGWNTVTNISTAAAQFYRISPF